MSGAFDRLKEEFLGEAEETLSAFREDLAAFGAGGSQDAVDRRRVDRAFRTAHSLKGVLGMFGLDEMARVAHALESVLDEIRAGRLAADRLLVDTLLEGNEALHGLLNVARGETAAYATDTNEVVRRLETLVRGASRDDAPPDPRDPLALVWERLDPQARAEVRKMMEAGRTIVVVASPDERVESVLREQGTIHAALAPDTSFTRRRTIVSSGASLFALAKSVGMLGEVLPCDAERVVRHTHMAVIDAAEPLVAEPLIAVSAAPAAATVRVRVERIDGLLEGLAGLLHAKSELDDAIAASPPAERMRRTTLTQILRRLDSTIRGLQEDVLDVRLVAIGTVVPKLQRIAWSAARESHKSIRLVADVGEVEVDKEIVDALVAPLAHLVRNAIDHGIEDEGTRRMLGKDPVGTIRVEARGQGQQTFVEIHDDGSGIDLERVLERARERGLLPQGHEVSPAQILDVLFAPGFTTRDTVSALSGRGVGLDAVREMIHRWGGTVDVETGARGTRFRLRVPTTRAILSGLLVRAAGETYVLPLAEVAQVIKVRLADVEHRNGGRSLSVAGRTLPVVDLAAALGVGTINPSLGLVPGIHLAVPGREAIVLVDDVGARRSVVTRGLGLVCSSVAGIIGITEVGSGRAAFLLDSMALMEARPTRSAPEEMNA